jgi:hypothetical protein
MGMSGSRTKSAHLGIEGPVARALMSCSGKAPETGHNCQSRSAILRQQDRGLADMLLDSFHTPRVLPPQLAALVVSLRTQAAERRRGTRVNDPPLAA